MVRSLLCAFHISVSRVSFHVQSAPQAEATTFNATHINIARRHPHHLNPLKLWISYRGFSLISVLVDLCIGVSLSCCLYLYSGKQITTWKRSINYPTNYHETDYYVNTHKNQSKLSVPSIPRSILRLTCRFGGNFV